MILSQSKDHIREAIKARASHKKLKGELLSALDIHLLQVSSKTDYSFSSFAKLLIFGISAFFKLSIVCFCGLFLYGKYLESDDSLEVENAGNETDSIPVEEYAQPVSESSTLKFNPAFKRELAKVSNEGAKVDPHIGLVQFIAGVIAVYLPEATDSGKVANDIVQISKQENIDPLYVAAIISVESRFSTKAKSGVGATGLMQLMPLTAKMLAEKFSSIPARPKLTDTKTNINLGISYLKELEDSYKGNKKLALAAYNMGPTKLNKILDSKGRIPGSVQRYAKIILSKTEHWNRHFEEAKVHALGE